MAATIPFPFLKNPNTKKSFGIILYKFTLVICRSLKYYTKGRIQILTEISLNFHEQQSSQSHHHHEFARLRPNLPLLYQNKCVFYLNEPFELY